MLLLAHSVVFGQEKQGIVYLQVSLSDPVYKADSVQCYGPYF